MNRSEAYAAFTIAAKAAGDAWNSGVSRKELKRLRQEAETARLAYNDTINHSDDHAAERAGIASVAHRI